MIENVINNSVRDWLKANRPAAVPATVEIRAAQDRAPVARPFLVVLCEDGRTRSEVLHYGVLVLRMKTRADEQDALAAAGWHHACLAPFGDPEVFRHLELALQQQGYWLRQLKKADYVDKADGRRGRAYEQRWNYLVQTGGL